MRYWIYWNDLVQGPFELEELISLHAFSEDLSVCMEGREDWVPASRVADLAPAIELLRTRRAPPPLPPPPPNHPPSSEPLQGEFFGEAQGQQHLFDSGDDPEGTFSFAPPNAAATAEVTPPAVTMPIRFLSGDHTPIMPQAAAPAPPVETPRRPYFEVLDMPTVRVPRGSPVKESPVRKEEPEPIVEVPPEPVVEAPAPAPAPEELSVPAVPADVFTEAPPAEIPESVLPEEDSYDVAASQKVAASQLKLLPWALGFLVALALIGSISYWVIDRYSSRAAIAEVDRLSGKKKIVVAATTPSVPSTIPLGPPTRPVAVPVITLPAKVAKPHAVPHIAKKAPKATIVKAIPVPVKAVVTPVPSPAPEAAPQEPEISEIIPTPPPVVKATPSTKTKSSAAADIWIGRQNEAIQVAMAKKIFAGKRTIGAHAKLLLHSMHDKELLHAAETGERLYLPDKSSWVALREEGPIYRVYLNFSALQANGERMQTHSYQFRVDMQKKEVTSDDNATRQDFLDNTTMPVIVHQAMADDIESILAAVDLLNKQKMRDLIARKNRSHNKKELKNIGMALASAQAKVQRATVYFRTRYPETALNNVAHAYAFTAILKANG